MRRSATPVAFRVAGPALLRACAHAPFALPAWPDVDDRSPAGTAAAREWLRKVWAIGPVAEAISHASPELAVMIRRQCTAEPADLDARKVGRSVLSLARYVLRMSGRPTPFGLMAGVAPAGFGPHPQVVWAGAHRAVAQAAAGWLAEVITTLQTSPRLLARLHVVVNTTLIVRGDQLIVAHQPVLDQRRGAVATEVMIRRTPAVRLVVDAARTPIEVADLVAKLHAEAPTVPVEQIVGMLSTLVRRGALITNLHAPSTEVDALGYLVRALDTVRAAQVPDIAELVRLLHETQRLLAEHNSTAATGGQAAVRERLTAGMRPWSRSPRHPLALDVRLDASAVLPQKVATDVEHAALVLARLSQYPYGTPAWRDYHRRFYERYGIGTFVPVLDVVDPDSGIGLPDGYPGTLVEQRHPPLSPREELLLTLVQSAALDGRQEVVLDEALIDALDAGPSPPRLPPHLEMAVRINASSQEALRQGRYTVEVVSVSRNAGGLTGRFLHVLNPADARQHTAALAALAAANSDTGLVQASFPPLDPSTANVTRAPQALPAAISIAEHRPHSDPALTVHDVAVGCDGRRLYLAVPAWGRRIEVSALHALNPRVHTPPLARFLIELGRAQFAQVTGFGWGAAATLPFRPRVRLGRIILTPATWLLPAADLPQPASSLDWDESLAGWRRQRRMPALVRMVMDDKRLLLDLQQPGHRILLRTQLRQARHAILTEVLDPLGAGWCHDRPHEVIVALRATAPPPWPPLPAPTQTRVVRRGHGDTPGTSTLLFAKLYGDLRRQDVVIAEHLPHLLAAFDTEPFWWYLRYRDADRLDPHLRLRIRLPGPDDFGPAARRVSTWANRLRHLGLLREVQYATSYSEPGRWGAGAALHAAETVFAADSRAVVTQLQQTHRPHRQALIAAHTVAIAIAYLGDVTAGMRWLTEHLPCAAPRPPVARQVFDQAVQISNPNNGWAALRGAPGGAAILAGWRSRDTALAAWRAHLDVPGPDTDGVSTDDALRHILHGHYIRAYGIDFDDEPVCQHLTRAAAQAWTARTRGART